MADHPAASESEMDTLEGQDATDLLLRDIQAGHYVPGTWLKQIDLETRYERGRNEIRRALDRLALKRVVEHVPNRGYRVYNADGRQAEEIAEIRIMLETGIVPKLVATASADDIKRLRTLADRFQALVLNGTVLELYEANLNFHRAFVQLSGNGELDSVVADLRQRTSSAPVSQWRNRARIEKSSREHHEMVDLLDARDAERLKALVEVHIRQA